MEKGAALGILGTEDREVPAGAVQASSLVRAASRRGGSDKIMPIQWKMIATEPPVYYLQ
jgi:hypothetical protein